MVAVLAVLLLCGGTATAFSRADTPNPTKPSPSFTTSSNTPLTGETVTFTSTSTPGLLGAPIASEEWDLNNDGDFTDASGSEAQRSFASAGPYTVALRVTDENGASDVATGTVNVQNRLPAADFSISPGSPSTLQTVTFSSTSTDDDGTIASYAWDLDNDGNFNDGSASEAQRSFPFAGTYTVRLLVTDNDGGYNVATHTVDVGNQAPLASFGYTPPNPSTGDELTLTSTSSDPDGSIASYSWDLNGDDSFGDADTAQTHVTFATPGNHTVRLQVTDNNGASDIAPVTVSVANRAPTAAFDYSPQSPQSGEQVTFNSTSTDPDGSIASLAWDLDNDGQFDDGTTATVQKTFAAGGTKPVKLRVTDNDGASNTITLDVEVGNRPPAASFTSSPSDPETGQQVTFSSTSTDPDGSIASIAWDLDNDGSFDDGSNSTAKRSFPTAGPYTIRVRATDDGGMSDIATATVNVANRAPAASFTSSPGSPKTGDPVTFDSTSTDPDGTIATLVWDFDNDGQFDDGAGVQAQATFALPGPHTVKLLAVDNDGGSAVATGSVQIANRAPVASFDLSPQSPTTLEQVTFTSTATDADGTIASYAWDLDNDGNFDDGTAAQVQKTFATPGAHTVKLRVTDDQGTAATASVSVQVSNRVPTASFTSSPQSPKTLEQVTFSSTSIDPDGTIASVAWDLDDDGNFDDGTAAQVQRSFPTAGTYTVELKATDNSGASVTTGANVQVANRPPTAAFGFSPATPTTAQQVTFSSASSDADGSIVSYSWDLDGDGNFGDSTLAGPKTTYATPGARTVRLQVTDNSGATDVATVPIDIGNRPPVANFDFTPASPTTLVPVTFNATATDPDGTIAAYAWDLDNDGQFDDGTTAQAQRSFPVAGGYTVKLRVTDSNGATVTVTKSVSAANQPPKAVFETSPATPTTDAPVTFTSSSTDPEGLPLTTSWDLDNDGTFEATGATVQKQFTAPGPAYPFKLKVVDASGAEDIASGTVALPNRPPIATVDHQPKQPQTRTEITFTATSSDPENRVKSLTWDVDDDGFDDGTGATLKKTYNRPGPYTVRFKIDDLDGGSTIAEDTVAVGNQPPKASFVVLPASPAAGSSATLVSTSLDPDTPLEKWQWDLNGDNLYDDAEGPEIQYTFPAAGTYTVGLRVLDSEDVADFVTQSVIVQPPPSPTITTPLLAPTGTSFRLLSPFPVVRLAGRIGKTGTRLRLFAIDAPPGARVVVMCRGRSCPFRLSARSAGNADVGDGKVHSSTSLRIRQLEKRVLKKGVTVTIYVTKAGVIGKYVQFKFLSRRPPARVDRCLMPAAPSSPVQCPS
jgi:PKD repeat protein